MAANDWRYYFYFAATFGAVLKFVVRNCDPKTGEPTYQEYDDEYVLEDLEITVADQIQKNKKTNFTAIWETSNTEGNILICEHNFS